MAYIAGDFTEITYNHTTLGSGSFYPKANSDSTLNLGGLMSADSDEDIAGNGQMIDKMTRNRWGWDGEIANDMNTANDLQTLKNLQQSPVPATYTFTHISGSVWKGTGKPVGKMEANGNTGVIKLKIQGSNDLKKISG